MPQAQEVASWIGREVVDTSGDKIGTLEAVYLDAETDQPEWALIKTGLFGGRSPLVPLVGVAAEGESVRVNFPKDQVKDAPSMKANDELSQQQERQLYEHYGLEYSFVPSGSGMAEAGAPEGAAGAAAAGGAAEADQPRTAGAPGAGSEATQTGEAPGAAPDQPQTAGAPGAGAEAAQTAGTSPAAGSGGDTSEAAGAGAATGAAGAGAASEGAERGSGGPASMPASGGASGQSTERAADAEGQPSEVIRLRKYIVTEHVPVQHEEVRVEREPIDEQNDAN